MSQNCEKIKIPQATSRGWIYCNMGGCFDMSQPTSETRRGRVQDGGDVCPTLMAGQTEICVFEGYEEI